MIKNSGYRTAFLYTGIFQGVVILIVAQFLRHPPAPATTRAGVSALRRQPRRALPHQHGDRSRHHVRDTHHRRAQLAGDVEDGVTQEVTRPAYFFGCASKKSNTFFMFSGVRMNGVM